MRVQIFAGSSSPTGKNCLSTVYPGEQLPGQLPFSETKNPGLGQGTSQFAWPRRRYESLLEHKPLCQGEGKSPGQFAQFHPIEPGPNVTGDGNGPTFFKQKVSCFCRTDSV